MKKISLFLFIIFVVISFISCIDYFGESPDPVITYVLTTETPIYYSYAKNKFHTFRELKPGKSVTLKSPGILSLSRNSDGSGMFFRDSLVYCNSRYEDEVMAELSTRTSIADYNYDYRRHLWRLAFGWEYSKEDEQYKLHVTYEMQNGELVNAVERDKEEYWAFRGGRHDFEIPVLLIYMIADNDLYSAAIETINQLESAYYPDGPIYIYLDAPKGKPYGGGTLLRLRRDKTPEIKSTIIKNFGELDSCDPENLKKLCTIVKNGGTYLSTLLWSHGTSWLPEFVNGDEINLNAFGYDDSSNSSLSIKAIAEAQTGSIVFDACRMASIEVFSCFEKQTIVAPSVDIEPLSYPYNNPKFLGSLLYQDYRTAIDLIIEYNQNRGKEISMTINKNEASYIEHHDSGYAYFKEISIEAFTKDFSSLLNDNYDSNYTNGKEPLNFATIRSSLLPLGTTNPGKATLYYDLLSLIQELEKGSGKTELQEALKKSVYVRSTPTILNGQESSKHCGISCYVPYHIDESISEDLVKLNQYYLTLPWGRMIGRYCKPLVP